MAPATAALALTAVAALLLVAAAAGVASPELGVVPPEVPWPPTHGFDFAFFCLVGWLGLLRLLLPIGTSIAGLPLLALVMAVAGYWRAVMANVRLLASIPVAFPSFLLSVRRTVRGAVVQHLKGERYVSLATHWRRVPHLVKALRGRGDVGVSGLRPRVIFALVSSQELAVAFAALAWAVGAFVPGSFSRMPCLDVWGWLWMQVDVVWVWPDVRRSALQALIMAAGSAYGLVLFRDYCFRCRDLREVESVRECMDEEGDMPFPEHLGPEPADADAMDRYVERARFVWRLAANPPGIWERIRLARPTFKELRFLAAVLYGFVTLGAADWLAQPGSDLYDILTFFNAAVAAWWGAIRSWSFETLAVTLVAMGVVSALVAFKNASELESWDEHYAYACYLYGDKYHGYRATSRRLGPRPTVLRTVRTWIGPMGRILLGVIWGAFLASMLLRPSSFAVYGQPEKFQQRGASAIPVATCPAALLPPTASSPRANVTAWAMGWAGVGGCDAASGFGSRWWCEVATGAKINLLAARAWRQGGMDGTQAALEALRAARCSGNALRQTHKDLRAEAVQWSAVNGTDPSPQELEEAALAALFVNSDAARAAESLATALTAVANAVKVGARGLPWAIRGDWALGLAWEQVRRRPGAQAGAAADVPPHAAGRAGAGSESKGPKGLKKAGGGKKGRAKKRIGAAAGLDSGALSPESAALSGQRSLLEADAPNPETQPEVAPAPSPGPASWVPSLAAVVNLAGSFAVLALVVSVGLRFKSLGELIDYLIGLALSGRRRRASERTGGTGATSRKAKAKDAAAQARAKPPAPAPAATPRRGAAAAPAAEAAPVAGQGVTAQGKAAAKAPPQSVQPSGLAAPEPSKPSSVHTAVEGGGKGKGKDKKDPGLSSSVAGPAPGGKMKSYSAAAAAGGGASGRVPAAANGAGGAGASAEAALADLLPFTASLSKGGAGAPAGAKDKAASPARQDAHWSAPPPPAAAPQGGKPAATGIFKWTPDMAARVASTAPRAPQGAWAAGPPPAAADAPTPPPVSPSHRPDIPVPVPIPGPSAAPASAAGQQAPPASPPILGLNPALARFLEKRAAASNTAAAAAGSAAGAGAKPAMLCVSCQATPRQVGVYHNASPSHPQGRLCRCLCKGCAAGFVVGEDRCPSCGDPCDRLINFY
ncbi:hypothetical protein HYH03_003018 [Edaphochlamys debaryana]|uniref:Uncharacterized protein n=1 Tax=Edaphochlamys debaryana TaxID=47281 RepID=A0A835Y9J7_9CHLO|nr:hypothetical protein HYH03_003018 [Edaphochlamys debaryana]|eukprot:KAG2498825.1 hypothetical protein HYH03_003018 [Edaphochlamys debaryana]